MARIKKISLIFCLSIVLFILESLIKYYFLNKIPKEGFYFLKNLLIIVYTPNQNAAFSLPLPQILIIIIVIVILIILGIIWLQSLQKQNLWEFAATSLIILGALSNLLDRLFYGYVIDYINIRIWPVFNLADVMIVAGIFIYILSEFKKQKTTIPASRL
ncbi:MAG: signal peptidase II [Patescibacteria group bacterium]